MNQSRTFALVFALALLGTIGMGVDVGSAAPTEEFSKTFGGSDTDFVSSVVQTSEGGFALGSFISWFDTESDDARLIKLSGDGNAAPTASFTFSPSSPSMSGIPITRIESQSVMRGEGDTFNITINQSTNETRISFLTTDEEVTEDLTDVTPQQTGDAFFELRDLEPKDVTVERGDTIQPTAVIANNGDGPGEQVIEYRIGDEKLEDGEIQLDPGLDGRIRVDEPFEVDRPPGEYTHGFYSEDDSATGTLTVTSSSGGGEGDAPTEEFNKTFGGSAFDEANSVVQTSDGGFALAGSTESFGSGDRDAWLIKTDPNGNKEFDRIFGGTDFDAVDSVVQTSDGGFALAGSTESFGSGGRDAWLIKTNSNGNIQRRRTFGGTENDGASSVVQTSDGGFALAGSTESFGSGDRDAWLIKTDPNGNKEFDRTFGGTNRDVVRSVVKTPDGGFALAGSTFSFGLGGREAWLIKTDANGNVEISETFGEQVDDPTSPNSISDTFWSVDETSDGGYILAGTTSLSGPLVFPDPGALLIKTDSNGNKQWKKEFGEPGPLNDARSVVETSDGGFALAGSGVNAWFIKTDSNGNVEINKTFGGSYFGSVVQTLDGGFALGGLTGSFGSGSFDAWLIKLTGSGGGNTPPTASFTFTPSSPSTSDTVTFDASSSSDSDGFIQSYSWDFGDGSTAIGQTASHSYSSSGTFTVTLTVTDNDGATSTATRTVSVSGSGGSGSGGTIFETDFEDIPAGQGPQQWEQDPRFENSWDILEVRSSGADGTDRKLRTKRDNHNCDFSKQFECGSGIRTPVIGQEVSKVEWFWKKKHRFDPESRGSTDSRGPKFWLEKSNGNKILDISLGAQNSGQEAPLGVGVSTQSGQQLFQNLYQVDEFSKFEIDLDFNAQEYTLFVDGQRLGTFDFLNSAQEVHRGVFKIGGWNPTGDSEIDEFVMSSSGEGDGDTSVSRIQFDYDDFGGSTNLEVNNDRRSVGDLRELDDATVGGGTVTVLNPATGPSSSGIGSIEITGTITSFSVGGQEFFVDNVVFGPRNDPINEVEFTTLMPSQSTDYVVGDRFTSSPSGVEIEVEEFELIDGSTLSGSGNSCTELSFCSGERFWTSNINLAFDFSTIDDSSDGGGGDLSPNNPFGDSSNNPVDRSTVISRVVEWNLNGEINGTSFTRSEIINFVVEWNLAS
jgi:PKD repeat protein